MRHLLRLKKEIDVIWIKDIKNLLRLKKESKSIKDRIIRDIWNLSEYEEDYYKPVRLIIFTVIKLKHYQ